VTHLGGTFEVMSTSCDELVQLDRIFGVHALPDRRTARRRCDIIEAATAEESGASPERSRHCDPDVRSSAKIREVRTSAVAGRCRVPRTPARPRYAAGVDTRRKGVRCGRFRSPQSSVPKTLHSL
jgi:hypothetical protein